MMRADPRVPGTGKPEPWREFAGHGPLFHMVRDLYDLTQAVSTPEKKKPKPHPRPEPGKRTHRR